MWISPEIINSSWKRRTHNSEGWIPEDGPPDTVEAMLWALYLYCSHPAAPWWSRGRWPSGQPPPLSRRAQWAGRRRCCLWWSGRTTLAPGSPGRSVEEEEWGMGGQEHVSAAITRNLISPRPGWCLGPQVWNLIRAHGQLLHPVASLLSKQWSPLSAQALSLPDQYTGGPAKFAALGSAKFPDLRDRAHWLPLTWKKREWERVECDSVSLSMARNKRPEQAEATGTALVGAPSLLETNRKELLSQGPSFRNLYVVGGCHYNTVNSKKGKRKKSNCP